MGFCKTSGEPTRPGPAYTTRQTHTVFACGLLGIWDLRIALDGGNGVPIGTASLGSPGTAGTLSAAPVQSPTGPLRGSIIPYSTLDGKLCTVVHITVPAPLGTYLHRSPSPPPRPVFLSALPAFLPCAPSGIHTQRPTLVTHSCPPPSSSSLFIKPMPSLRLRGGTNPSCPSTVLSQPRLPPFKTSSTPARVRRSAVPPTVSATQQHSNTTAALHHPLRRCLLGRSV